MKKIVFIVAVMFIAVIFAEIPVSAKTDWRLEKEKNDIAVYSRHLDGSPFIQVKGVTVVNAELAVVGEVLKDDSASPQWMSSCIERRDINILDRNNRIVYNILNFPWPFQNRDAVIKSATHIDPNTGDVVVNSWAINEPLVPINKQYVRLTELRQQFILRYIEKEKTRVSFIVHLDPGGKLPVRVVNMGVKETPYKDLLGLKKMVKKEKYRNVDPLGEENLENTIAIVSARLKQYINDEKLVKLFASDVELIKLAMNAGSSEKGRMEIAAGLLKKTSTDKAFSELIFKDKELIEIAGKNKRLIETIINDSHLMTLLMTRFSSKTPNEHLDKQISRKILSYYGNNR